MATSLPQNPSRPEHNSLQPARPAQPEAALPCVSARGLHPLVGDHIYPLLPMVAFVRAASPPSPRSFWRCSSSHPLYGFSHFVSPGTQSSFPQHELFVWEAGPWRFDRIGLKSNNTRQAVGGSDSGHPLGWQRAGRAFTGWAVVVSSPSYDPYGLEPPCFALALIYPYKKTELCTSHWFEDPSCPIFY